MPTAPSAHALEDYIRRDPEGWSGIPFSYFRRTPDAGARTTPDGALMIVGTRGDYAVLGASLPDAVLALPDIAQDWQLTCAILSAMSESDVTPPKAPPTQPVSILVVEDDAMTSQLVTQHLKKYGNVLATSNAREATANYMVHRPNLVFLDIHYGEDAQDGFDVLGKLLSADKNVFAVMVSGDRHAGTIFKAFAMGARGFIAKPASAASFARYLTAFCQRS